MKLGGLVKKEGKGNKNMIKILLRYLWWWGHEVTVWHTMQEGTGMEENGWIDLETGLDICK
jgi:hypothetical protein